ncbi:MULTISPECIES: TolB-like translocation protein [unclassified Streptomyces]|uniref:TolB-like translocation protein n=1 Tax=unclassified Streptomyces TaxID=2593676 RepID=UPI000DC75A4D|nr:MULTISPECIES: TolB-like translocation protein [unclassified Streptomyces]AWZ08453.1 TolB-like translocation protein [Streptomyces sp. ICC4]AWZ13978.1 TolB-like translocation protein [Streptomyces sp. ICC1]
MTRSRRLLVLALAVLLLGGAAGAMVVRAAARAEQTREGDPTATEGRVTLDRQDGLAFLNGAQGPHRGAVVSVPAQSPQGGRTASDLTCQRFHAAAGTGVCLNSSPGALAQDNKALIVDAQLRTVRSFPMAGTPSRARVSPSGHFAAWTVFVAGESYGAAFFSTRTSIADVRTGTLEPDLEKFAIELDGRPYSAGDVNFWGVTFSKDDDTFYATLGTGNQTYLVKGSISRRSVTTLAKNVECPSLSPDETRVAYKKRVQRGASLWREHVLDLRTLREQPLAEKRSVDDQALWLDDRTLAYALPTEGSVDTTDLWTVPADGTGAPRVLAPAASSPTRLG